MTRPTTKTRICIISDTHTLTPNSAQNTTNPYRHPLPSSDILLHAGDITKVGLKDEHEVILDMLKVAPAELKLVVAGNHDITLDEEYYTRIGHYRHRYRTDHTTASATAGKENVGASSEEEGRVESVREIKALWTSEEAVNAGIRYMEEGVQTFTLGNGARFTVYASPYTPEFCQWAFAYDRDTDRFNPPQSMSEGVFVPPNPVPDDGVDIMLTHGPPYGILDKVVGTHASVGCENLFRAVERAKPRLHVFGHIHEAYGAARLEWSTRNQSIIQCDKETTLEDRCAYTDVSGQSMSPLRVGDETLFVNASVVTVQYQAVNPPWLVDLELPSE
ncbi:Ser/Thr protein [Aspergillus flavus AF70]|nr:Ser/Thr protein [Aspergillus flavus AF70]